MKKIVSLLLTLSLMVTLFGGVSVGAAQSSVSNPIIDYGFTNTLRFDVITFGSYWQSDFKRKDPIRWVVLKVEGNDIYCVAEKNLFNVYGYEISYDLDREYQVESDLSNRIYKIYNETFYNEAFSDKEKYDILEIEKAHNVWLPQYADLYNLRFYKNTKTNYCKNNRSLLGDESATITTVKTQDPEGKDIVEAKYPYYNSTSNLIDYPDPINDAFWGECAIRPALHIRKSSNLYRKVGTIGHNTQYLNPKATKISKIKAKKKKLKITWGKKGRTDGVMGYKLQYSTSKKFKKAKTIKISNNWTKTKTIKKLKSKKRYYIRIRTYSEVDIRTYYSKWSKAKSKKTK
ncbi:MAG: hypothetical protein IKF24_05055 [Eubacterium sp.]|nr:hypothetical protein [Eubacterium sp.]